MEDLKLISSRRAYEFRMDDLRLSMLCLPEVRTQIQQLFGFEVAVIGTPRETFGPVAATLPAGLVLNTGLWQPPVGSVVPIRFLHFEQKRIVIDVAGPSSAIDLIFEGLIDNLESVVAPDGSPVVGQVERVLDYSEFTARYSFPLVQLLAPEIRDLVSEAAGRGETSDGVGVLPTFVVHPQPLDEEYLGLVHENRILQFALRAGTSPAEGVYYSGAPLESEAHRDYLAGLEAKLAHQPR